ncbi:hypothetical protein K443DRAFT_117276 [Laccaria amethystina LaAM-08-1]|uniref:Uncharacterized protein n=1 Tax=Laccaria amethystina LaAM-08-1 TaxID=1095629 RepID=A0A0C9WGS9_9AGAR|nr:hypothetical protein K443DRAFT_117276 [Laccaria amethystina LaAM-08-1]
MHHIFVYCEVYEEWRVEAGASVVEWTKEKLNTLEVEEKTFFYLGQLPKIDPLINMGGVESGEIYRRRLKSHIINGWHLSCIRLAGRIFGDFQRRMAVLNDVKKKC